MYPERLQFSPDLLSLEANIALGSQSLLEFANRFSSGFHGYISTCLHDYRYGMPRYTGGWKRMRQIQALDENSDSYNRNVLQIEYQDHIPDYARYFHPEDVASVILEKNEIIELISQMHRRRVSEIQEIADRQKVTWFQLWLQSQIARNIANVEALETIRHITDFSSGSIKHPSGTNDFELYQALSAFHSHDDIVHEEGLKRELELIPPQDPLIFDGDLRDFSDPSNRLAYMIFTGLFEIMGQDVYGFRLRLRKLPELYSLTTNHVLVNRLSAGLSGNALRVYNRICSYMPGFIPSKIEVIEQLLDGRNGGGEYILQRVNNFGTSSLQALSMLVHDFRTIDEPKLKQLEEQANNL